MNPHKRRSGILMISASLIVAAMPLTHVSSASATACAPTPDLLARTPAAAYPLPGGASVRIWESGHATTDKDRRRLAVVAIPRGTLTPTVATAPTLSRGAKPSSMVSGDPDAVVVINGGTFNAAAGGIPDRAQITSGVARKLVRKVWSRGFFGGVAVDSVAKSITGAAFDLAGEFRSTAGTMVVGGVNWQFLTPEGASVYTSDWGRARPHPAGPRTVVVRDGRVAKVLSGRSSTRQPAPGESWVTAPAGSAAAATLARVRVGDPADLWYGATGSTRYAGYPATEFSQPSGGTGSGGAIVTDGAVNAPCSARDEYLRPRSAIAWDAQGNMMVVAIAGPRNTRWGGATVHQFAGLLHQLGAVTAIRLDGGTSTTLWVRKSVGGGLVRLDRSGAEYERPVVDALVFRAG